MDNYSRAGILADIYGSLLTEKQFDTLCLYLYEDCSLYEISEKMGVTRQAAHDIIKRSLNLLEDYEEKLGIYSKLLVNRDNENKIKDMLLENRIDEALTVLHEIVEN
ncbi:MAG TPA: sigma factor-like helix-turn-helix DNA-binding protein [Clostridia bacterium]|jgi:hypothetical protein|nr:MAG: putative DNA-binding protein [Firmicutes bacterium ADurb.Bin146]HOD93580.1 sigma factor-like helix-turn-helix DNA-binding protein [Clostridia bacterium]